MFNLFASFSLGLGMYAASGVMISGGAKRDISGASASRLLTGTDVVSFSVLFLGQVDCALCSSGDILPPLIRLCPNVIHQWCHSLQWLITAFLFWCSHRAFSASFFVMLSVTTIFFVRTNHILISKVKNNTSALTALLTLL